MTIHELTKEQLVELKQAYLCETQNSVSWGELADADEIISDDEIFNQHEGTEFVEEDFCCNVVGC